MTSQNENTPTDSDTPLGAVIETDSVEEDTLPDPDIDLSSLRENVATSAATAVLQADLTAIKRATGHIPGLQSRLDAAERAVKQVETLQATNKQLASRLDSLVSALSDASLITPGQAQALVSAGSDSNSELLTKFGELEERLTRTAAVEPEVVEVDPRVIAYNAQIQAADTAVYAYAKSKGYEGDIPEAEFQRAQRANPDDISAAILEVARYIDRQIAATARRVERADAASGGVTERSPRKGAVTADQLKNMSLAEVMSIPAAERDRIAASG